MPTLPWTKVNETSTADAVVMASRFKLRTWRHVLPFFLDSMRIHRQVRGADGAYGVSLELPILPLVTFTAIAVLVGVLAAILPARRAGKLNVLAALQYE